MRQNILILGHNAATQFIDIYNQYTRLFDKKKYCVTVAYLTGLPNEEVKKRTLAEEVVFLNCSKRSIRGLKIGPIRTVLSLCRKKNFQQVICHRYKPSYIMMWVAHRCPIPRLIFVMHELKTMTSIGRKLLAACLYRPNMWFAGVSNAVRDDLRRHLWVTPQDKIVTLYNMIDVELTEPQLYSREEARKKLGLAADSFVFGNVGRLVPNKDQASLIQAFSQIKSYCPQTKLIIIGNGILEEQLKHLTLSLGLSQDVIFTGYLPSGFKYMKAFDCFVLSSTQEAFGRVLLEAMIAKCPIIASRVNGIPEVVGDRGTIINAGDPNALASAMKDMYVLMQENRHQLAEKAYQHLLLNFSIPAFHKQYWHLSHTDSIKE